VSGWAAARAPGRARPQSKGKGVGTALWAPAGPAGLRRGAAAARGGGVVGPSACARGALLQQGCACVRACVLRRRRFQCGAVPKRYARSHSDGGVLCGREKTCAGAVLGLCERGGARCGWGSPPPRGGSGALDLEEAAPRRRASSPGQAPAEGAGGRGAGGRARASACNLRSSCKARAGGGGGRCLDPGGAAGRALTAAPPEGPPMCQGWG
jgi:hypothetical protein